MPPERPELVADEVERRHEGNRDRGRPEGAETPDLPEQIEKDEGRSEDGEGNDEEPRALDPEVAAVLPKRPKTVPGVVAGHGDHECARLGHDVVDAGPEQSAKNTKVDQIADRADDGELAELLPVPYRSE